jgi:hypothetical protein
MPYTKDKPQNLESSDQLRARIPGWGADLNPADRPSVPRERFDPGATGAHWDLPEQQPESIPRERSIEHLRLTPVFGTAQPLRGLSGAVRRHAYSRYSEGRLAHWLLLMIGDRIDAAEARLGSYASLRPDNLLAETGVRSELHRHPVKSRAGRIDRRHQLLDPLIVAGPAVARGLMAAAVIRAGIRRVRRARPADR